MSSDKLAQAFEGIEKFFEEKRAAHEAEKQAGPVAGLIGKMTAQRAKFFLMRFRQEEAMLGPNEQAALSYAVSALEREQYAAPPSPLSEQDKEDAELLKWLAHAGEVSIYMLRDQPGDGDIVCDTDFGSGQASTFRDAIRAARAKKEQP